MRIGVLIVAHDAGALLARCLAAVDRQARRADRVLVVDAGSTDPEVTAQSGRPGVEWLRCERNEGFARASNLGVTVLDDCEWIAFLNPDAFPEPAWLASLANQLDLSLDDAMRRYVDAPPLP